MFAVASWRAARPIFKAAFLLPLLLNSLSARADDGQNDAELDAAAACPPDLLVCQRPAADRAAGAPGSEKRSNYPERSFRLL